MQNVIAERLSLKGIRFLSAYMRCPKYFIQITKHQQSFTITVEDDGKGFDIRTLPVAKGTGLQNIRSRVDYLKGSFIAESEQGNGTSIVIEIPGNN